MLQQPSKKTTLPENEHGYPNHQMLWKRYITPFETWAILGYREAHKPKIFRQTRWFLLGGDSQMVFPNAFGYPQDPWDWYIYCIYIWWIFRVNVGTYTKRRILWVMALVMIPYGKVAQRTSKQIGFLRNLHQIPAIQIHYIVVCRHFFRRHYMCISTCTYIYLDIYHYSYKYKI